MKQIKLFVSLFLIGVMAVSCEKDNDNDENNTDVKLVTKIIETFPDGSKTTRNYEYNGAKIVKVTETSDEGTTFFTYKYTGDDITKITETNEDNQVLKTISFLHVGDKLSMWAENYETDSEFDFLSDHVVTINDDPGNREASGDILKYHTAGVFQKEITIIHPIDNWVFDMAVGQSTGDHEYASKSNLVSMYFYSSSHWHDDYIDGIAYFFTDHPNPHQNITGWTKLEKMDPTLYGKNCIARYSNIPEDAIYNYVYDSVKSSPNMPTTMTKGKDGLNLTGYSSTQYFYNK